MFSIAGYLSENTTDDPIGAGLSIALAASTAGAFVKAGGLQTMALGAAYSIGGEPLVGEIGYGAVVTRGGPLTKEGIRSTVLHGKAGGFSTSLKLQNIYGGPGVAPSITANSRGIFSSTMGAGIMKQGFLSSAIPIASLAYGGIGAYSDGGAVGLGQYLVSDVLGNYYGTQASLQVGEVVNAARANVVYGITPEAANALQKGDIISRIKSIGGSGMLGRALPTLGGIMGSVMGMELGKNVGRFGANLLSGDSFAINETAGAFVGGLGGAIAGAKFGAYMTSSIGGAIIGGSALLAGAVISNTTMSLLESGFQNMNKNRQGLGFAGDTAHYFTRNAVTMRERAVQAMHKSHLNARSAFGQEANIVHMNRDMFSQYKRY